MGGVAGSVTIAVGVISDRAVLGEFPAAGRLRELPDGRVGYAARGGRWRVLHGSAAGRRRAGVVVNPIDGFPRADMIANVVCGDY